MARLLDLPMELLLAIFTYFHPVEDRKLLLSICEVSRATRRAAQQLLFSYFDTGTRCIHCNSLSCKNRVGDGYQLRPLIPFTRTIIARPDLGIRVQMLMIREHTRNPHPMLQWPNALSADTIRHYANAIQTLKVKNKSRWLSAIAGCIFGPFMIVLISQTPNVKLLSIVLDWDRLSSFLVLARQMQRRIVGFPYLGNLRSLEINCYDKRPIQLQTIIPILALPRLQEVSIAYCAGSSDTEWPAEIVPGSLRLSSISLSPAGIDKDCLARLVAACARLKRFTYVVRDYSWLGLVEPPQIQPVLYPQRNSLEEVRIEYQETWNATMVNPDWCPKYGSFRDFTSLKHMDLEQALMMPAEGLPNSLETLIIRQVDYPIFDMMTKLVSTFRAAYPSLREVNIRPYALAPYAMVGLHRHWRADYHASDDWFWRAFFNSCQRLEKIFESTGVKLVIECDAWYHYKTDAYNAKPLGVVKQ